MDDHDAGDSLADGNDTEGALSDEPLRAVFRGVGASLLVTGSRLILVRDRPDHRPMSGVQTLAIDRIGQIAIELGTRRSGRVVVHDVTGREWSSVFFDARSADRARAVVDVARPMIARARRRRRITDGREHR